MKQSNYQEKQRKIARERLEILCEKADEIFSRDTKRADRYVEIARRLAMKLNLRLSKEQKRRFCKHCKKYLRSGNNARIRIREGKIIIYCYNCRKYTRIPITKKGVPS